VPLMVPCSELLPGMRLAEAFYWQDMMMLSGDTVLTASDIASLRGRFPEHCFKIFDPQLDEVVEFEDDSRERTVAQTAKRRVSACISEVAERVIRNSALRATDITRIQSVVLDVIKYLEENPVEAALVDNLMSGQGYLSEHIGNVFYLSMLLGTAARQYVTQERQRQSVGKDLNPHLLESLVPLGLGVMLMDVGMLPLRSLYTQEEPLTPELWNQIRAHPNTGADLLPEEFSATAKTLVRTHHENMDGSGYPEGLLGERLHVFSRIVRIADAYDAGTAVGTYKEAKSSIKVLWEMCAGPYRRYYDQKLTRVFVHLIQPFPIGAKIRLQTGQYAVVVKYNRENPIAPIVIVAFDADNQRLPLNRLSKPMYLGERPELRAASFRGEDLAFMYGLGPKVGRQSRVGLWPSLFEAAYP